MDYYCEILESIYRQDEEYGYLVCAQEKKNPHRIETATKNEIDDNFFSMLNTKDKK